MGFRKLPLETDRFFACVQALIKPRGFPGERELLPVGPSECCKGGGVLRIQFHSLRKEIDSRLYIFPIVVVAESPAPLGIKEEGLGVRCTKDLKCLLGRRWKLDF